MDDRAYGIIDKPIINREWDGDISWTVTFRGHFFSKWATSRGHCQRVTSRGRFLVTFRGHFRPREVFFLGDISWTFLGEI